MGTVKELVGELLGLVEAVRSEEEEKTGGLLLVAKTLLKVHEETNGRLNRLENTMARLELNHKEDGGPTPTQSTFGLQGNGRPHQVSASSPAIETEHRLHSSSEHLSTSQPLQECAANPLDDATNDSTSKGSDFSLASLNGTDMSLQYRHPQPRRGRVARRRGRMRAAPNKLDISSKVMPTRMCTRSSRKSMAGAEGAEPPLDTCTMELNSSDVSAVERDWVKDLPLAISRMNMGAREKMLDIVIDVEGESTYLGTIPVKDGALSRNRIQRAIERLGIDPEDIIDVSLQESDGEREGKQVNDIKTRPCETETMNSVDIGTETSTIDQEALLALGYSSGFAGDLAMSSTPGSEYRAGRGFRSRGGRVRRGGRPRQRHPRRPQMKPHYWPPNTSSERSLTAVHDQPCGPSQGRSRGWNRGRGQGYGRRRGPKRGWGSGRACGRGLGHGHRRGMGDRGSTILQSPQLPDLADDDAGNNDSFPPAICTNDILTESLVHSGIMTPSFFQVSPTPTDELPLPNVEQVEAPLLDPSNKITEVSHGRIEGNTVKNSIDRTKSINVVRPCPIDIMAEIALALQTPEHMPFEPQVIRDVTDQNSDGNEDTLNKSTPQPDFNHMSPSVPSVMDNTQKTDGKSIEAANAKLTREGLDNSSNVRYSIRSVGSSTSTPVRKETPMYDFSTPFYKIQTPVATYNVRMATHRPLYHPISGYQSDTDDCRLGKIQFGASAEDMVQCPLREKQKCSGDVDNADVDGKQLELDECVSGDDDTAEIVGNQKDLDECADRDGDTTEVVCTDKELDECADVDGNTVEIDNKQHALDECTDGDGCYNIEVLGQKGQELDECADGDGGTADLVCKQQVSDECANQNVDNAKADGNEHQGFTECTDDNSEAVCKQQEAVHECGDGNPTIDSVLTQMHHTPDKAEKHNEETQKDVRFPATHSNTTSQLAKNISPLPLLTIGNSPSASLCENNDTDQRNEMEHEYTVLHHVEPMVTDGVSSEENMAEVNKPQVITSRQVFYMTVMKGIDEDDDEEQVGANRGPACTDSSPYIPLPVPSFVQLDGDHCGLSNSARKQSGVEVCTSDVAQELDDGQCQKKRKQDFDQDGNHTDEPKRSKRNFEVMVPGETPILRLINQVSKFIQGDLHSLQVTDLSTVAPNQIDDMCRLCGLTYVSFGAIGIIKKTPSSKAPDPSVIEEILTSPR